MEEEKKVYIGNLDYSVTDEELNNFIKEKELAVKETTVIKDKYTGRSKGFGFAKFDTDEEVQKAVETLNGFEFKSRKLNVSKARKKTDSRFNSRRNSGSSGGYRDRRNF